MKHLKNLFTTLLFFCTTVASAHDFKSGDIYYKIIDDTNKTVAVTYRGNLSSEYSNEYTGTVVIPESVTYFGTTYSVTSIGNSAFSNCYGLTSITIPNSVTSIGDYAFCNCHGLTSITIPTSVTSIGDDAFYGCDGLTSVTIPNSVTSIGVRAFQYCYGLTSVTIPNSVTSIEYAAFSDCDGLTSITIPNSVTSIGVSAFSGCDGLKEVHISDIVAWYNISFGNAHANPLYYASNLYINNEIVTDFVIPDDITEIKRYTFVGCNFLTSVEIPNSVTSIGDEAFDGCSRLTSVKIPTSVTSIGDEAFDGCSRLTAVHISDLSAWCKIDFNNSTANPLYYANNLYINNELVTDLVIPDDITEIKNYAFSGCTSLASVTLNENISTIGSGAFEGCENLSTIYNLSKLVLRTGASDNGSVAYYANNVYDNFELIDNFLFVGNKLTGYIGDDEDITLPENYNGGTYSIGDNAFKNNQYIRRVTISNNVTGIGSYAFLGCSNLHSITVGSSVLNVGDSPFPSNIKKVIFFGNTPPRDKDDKKYNPQATKAYVSNVTEYGYGIEYARLSSMFEVDGVIYVPLSTKECDVIDCRYSASAANISVDSIVTYRNRKMTVKNVQGYSFYKNNNIKQAYLNNDGYLGSYAFYNSDSISGNVIVDNNGYIGDSAFYDCDGVKSVNVSNNGYIGESAFYDCDGIESVNASNKGNIEANAFYSCSNLTNATIKNEGYIGMSAFESSFTSSGENSIIDVRSSGEIKSSAFKGCTGLVTANLFNCGNIGNNAFQTCTSLASLTFGEDVDSLGNYAFSNCASLKEFAIPDNIPSMGTYCFSHCTALEKMAIGTGVDGLNEGIFMNCSSLIDMSVGVNVKSIRDKVFYDCSSLPEINIPKATKNIAGSVFHNCSSLELVVFENRADSIVLGSNGGSPMFSSCPLDSVYVGGKLNYSTLQSQGYSPFYGNESLRSITFNDVEENIYDKEFMNCSNLQNVALGNGIKSIGVEAFRNCTALPRITTPNSVTAMGKFVFAGCTSLATAQIGDGTVAVNESAFRDCTSLVDIKLGSSISSIGMSSFLNCSTLPEITIPQATTSIADSVFNECRSLARFYAEDGTNTLTMGRNAAKANNGKIGSNCPLFIDCQLDSVYLGRNLSYMKAQEYGYSPFYFNKTLRAVVIGDNVKQVFPNQFYQCRKLEYVSVGNGVTSVGDWAFSSCVSLDHFSFGVGLATIGKEAFSDCTLVTKIVSSRNEPPVCGDQALADIDMWECIVYVPEDYIDMYMVAPQWEDFWIEGAEYTIKFMLDGEVYEELTVKYGAEIKLPEEPAKEGYTFVGWKDILSVMPAYDVIVNAEFVANNYTITYIVDGEVYEVSTAAYETVLTPIEAPEKDGYTFNRWETLPQTMPAENIEVVAVYDKIPAEVKITVGQYGSTVYSSRYALDFSNVEGFKAYAATGYNTTTGVITMTRIETSDVGIGLYLVAAPGEYIVPIIEYSDNNSLNMLVGNLENSTVNSVSSDGLYANYKYTIKSGDKAPKFYQYGDNSSISAGKAYLQIPLDWIGSNALKSIGIRFDEGDATDVDDIEGEGVDINTIYDLDGRTVEKAANGIYIVNGKKVFIK